MREMGTTEEGTRFIRSNGSAFAAFEAGESFTAEYEILRADLCALFIDATEGLSGVEYRFGVYVTAVTQSSEKVDVEFANGGKETFDVLIAADGSTSKTRSMILPPQILENSYHFIGQYIAYFSIPSKPTDPRVWQWYNTTKGLCVMIRPHRNPGTMGAYLSIVTPAHGVQDKRVEEAMNLGTVETKKMLREYFETAGWEAKRVLDGMDSADDFYMSRCAQVKLPKWTNGRGVVLGDAAFATFGVGTSLAVESAYCLAGELGKIKSSADVPAALERYEEVFRQGFKGREELPPWFPQSAFPQGKWTLRLRDFLLWVVSKTAVYKLFQGGGEEVGWKWPDYDWDGTLEKKS